jgi:hypothetical protein
MSTKLLSLPTELMYELDGVIHDVEQGHGFDTVCLDTLKRVRDHLPEWQRLLEEAEQHRTGKMVMIPSNRAHAESMLQVAEFYLRQYQT